MTSLSHGVPQLIVPDGMWDSMEKSLALADCGAGMFVSDFEGVSAERLRSHIVSILDDPSFRVGAARVRREIVGTPSPNDIVPVLEKLTAEHRASRSYDLTPRS
jgi:UDP:flavonoid glycosyltransferase YjiC (YdhE family)